MKKKIFALIILVATLAILLSACGQIDYTYKQNRDGTYTQKIAITIDDDGSVSAYDYTAESAITALKNGFEKRGYKVCVDGKSLVAEKVFEDIKALYENEFANGIYVDEDSITDDENAFIKERTVFGEFKTSDDYINRNTIAYSAILLEGGVESYAKAQQIASALVNSKRSYTYITPYKSTETNADSVTKNDDGYYVHTWNDVSSTTPIITTQEIKGAMWYGIAIIIAVFALLVAVVVKLVIERKK